VSSNDTAEYVRTLGAQNPTMNNSAAFATETPVKAKIKLSHAEPLTEGSTVTIEAWYVAHTDLADIEGTLEQQSLAADTTWPFTSGTITTSSGSTDFEPWEPAVEAGKLPPCVRLWTDEEGASYSYRVPSGSDSPIGISYGSIEPPLCVSALGPTRGAHYQWVARASCRMADGLESTDPRTIVDDIFNSLPTYACVNNWTTKLVYKFPNPAGGYTVRNLLKKQKGSCGPWARYLLALCNFQGIGSADGLKSGNFNLIGTMIPTEQPWTEFRVEHKGINNSGDPSEPKNYKIVKDGEYPIPAAGDVQSLPKTWWADSPGYPAFRDHEIVFFDGAGAADSLYDPSFPPAGGSPVTVAYPQPNIYGLLTYGQGAGFMANYFESSCPYLHGNIPVEYQDKDFLHIHSNDFANPGAIPNTISFWWQHHGGHWDY